MSKPRAMLARLELELFSLVRANCWSVSIGVSMRIVNLRGSSALRSIYRNITEDLSGSRGF